MNEFENKFSRCANKKLLQEKEKEKEQSGFEMMRTSHVLKLVIFTVVRDTNFLHNDLTHWEYEISVMYVSSYIYENNGTGRRGEFLSLPPHDESSIFYNIRTNARCIYFNRKKLSKEFFNNNNQTVGFYTFMRHFYFCNYVR